MKYFLIILILTINLLASTTHKATVLQSLGSAGYTYIQVKEGAKEYWIAMTERKVIVGQDISFTEQSWMSKFHSKTLNRTFDMILFASDEILNPRQNLENIKVDIMTSSLKEKNTITIAELLSNRDKYEGKEITIKAEVTKISLGIMKRNWVHLSDGSRFQNIYDIVFTTSGNVPKIGEIVYAKGTVAKNVDFGFRYFYPVIVENSSF